MTATNWIFPAMILIPQLFALWGELKRRLA